MTMPKANQSKTEPIPPTIAHDPPVGDAHRPPPEAGASSGPGPRMGAAGAVDRERAAGVAPPDAEHAYRAPGRYDESPVRTDTGEGARQMQESARGYGGESPGDLGPSPAPSYFAARGTSETSPPVDGVRTVAVAQRGKADGETDTRVSPAGDNAP